MMKKNHIYRIVMVGTIAVVLLNTWVAVHAIRTLFSAESQLLHTLQVLSQTETVALQIRTADSTSRGFLLTGNPIFEQRFNESAETVYAELDTLQKATADNRSQQDRIGYTRQRVAAKLGALEAAVAIRHGHPTGGIDPEVMGLALSENPDGKVSVLYCIQQMENEEQRLLQDRENESKAAHRSVTITGAGASILDIVLLIVAFELLVRAQRNRERIEQSAEQIARLNTELQSLNTELEERVEQRTRELAVSNQELEAFSYSVSHDLRAPLRTIDGFSLALKEDFSDKLTPEGQDYINRVRGGVQRMGALIDALLQLSRVTRSDVQRERVDLSQLARLIFDELQAADPSREIEFVAQPGVLALADQRLMRIAFENLIGNAWKYSARKPNARIEFGSDLKDGRAVYFIRDNGAGFDMQYVDRLFTAFQRLHGDRDFKGSGIGLATVSRIIRRHHGTIWAEGEPEKGATFYFTLEA
ncbi:MAG TPA: ATP-binding protein [Acidobacteriaceae bacterium]|jgi:signal transduction histidine kinase